MRTELHRTPAARIVSVALNTPPQGRGPCRAGNRRCQKRIIFRRLADGPQEQFRKGRSPDGKGFGIVLDLQPQTQARGFELEWHDHPNVLRFAFAHPDKRGGRMDLAVQGKRLRFKGPVEIGPALHPPGAVFHLQFPQGRRRLA